MSRTLILAGVALVALGLLCPWLSKLGLGRLPGDISFRQGGMSFHFPIVTCLLLSALASLVIWAMRR